MHRIAAVWIARQTACFLYLWLSATCIYVVNNLNLGPKARAFMLLPFAGLHLAMLPLLIDSGSDPLSVMPTTGILSFAAFKVGTTTECSRPQQT